MSRINLSILRPLTLLLTLVYFSSIYVYRGEIRSTWTNANNHARMRLFDLSNPPIPVTDDRAEKIISTLAWIYLNGLSHAPFKIKKHLPKVIRSIEY